MGSKQFLAIGFRLFALWLAVSAIQLFLATAALRQAIETWGDKWWIGLVVVGVFVGAALLLWGLSGALSRVLLTGLNTPSLAGPWSGSQVVGVGCALMGLWWLKEAVVPLVAVWIRAVALASQSGQSTFDSLGVSGKSAVAADILQIGIALFFLCRPHRIVTWVLRQGAPEAVASETLPGTGQKKSDHH